MEQDFLGYLDEWDDEVKARPGFTDMEKKKMTLSQETLEGLRMTGIELPYSLWIIFCSFIFSIFIPVHSFVELAKFLFTLKEGLFILSERLNQDPLESFFGQQRARGGRSDNPNVRTFQYNTQAIRVQRSMVVGDGGNIRKRKEQWTKDLDEISRPLTKRPRRLIIPK